MRRPIARLLVTAMLWTLPMIAAPAVAVAAKRSVVILSFSGPRSEAARKGLFRGIKKRVRLVKLSKFNRAARKLGVAADSPIGIGTICGKLRCHAVIRGVVQRAKNRRYRVTVTVLDGASGEPLGQRSLLVKRSSQRLVRAGKELGKRSLQVISRGRYRRQPPPAAVAVVPPPPPPPERVFEEPPEEDPLFAEKDDEKPDAKEAEPVDAKAAETNYHGEYFEVYAGVGAAKRSIDLAGADPVNDRKYDGGFFPEITIGGELYPLAWATDSFWRNLGLAVSYAHHLTISTDLPENPLRPPTCDFADEIDTTSQRVVADLKLRWPMPFGGAFQPTLLAMGGYGWREFALGPNDVMPSFSYRYLRFGVSLRVPLGTPLFALEAGGDVQPILAVGQEAVDAFGERGSGIGWAVRAGLRGQTSFGLFYFASMEYQSFSLDFDGLDPATHDLRECSADRADPSSGSDTYLRLFAGLGYAI